MPWIYESSTGNLIYSEDGNLSGNFVGKGYSGKKGFKNNVLYDQQKNIGPIPPGLYMIGLSYHSATKGQLTMNLNPFGHNAFGRNLFRIHGNNNINDASEGCIILAPDIRKKIGDSGDKVLVVVRKMKIPKLPAGIYAGEKISGGRKLRA